MQYTYVSALTTYTRQMVVRVVGESCKVAKLVSSHHQLVERSSKPEAAPVGRKKLEASTSWWKLEASSAKQLLPSTTPLPPSSNSLWRFGSWSFKKMRCRWKMPSWALVSRWEKDKWIKLWGWVEQNEREQCRETTFSWLWERGRWRVVYRSRVTPAVLVISLAPNIFSLSQKYFFMCVKIFLASLRERRWRVVYRSRVTPAELVISLPPLLGEHQSWLSLCSRARSYFLFEWKIFL